MKKALRVSAAALCVSLMFAVASCSAGPASDEKARRADAPALLVQCALFYNRLTLPNRMSWLDSQGRVALPDSGKVNDFGSWYQSHKATLINGKRLEDWADTAARDDKLPGAVCGTGGQFTARTLQAQVYPGKPNPWHG